MVNQKKIVIVGPTGIGKSSLAIKLALRINGEIISADSMQIYQEMNIGTAKPNNNELSLVPHYLIGHVSPNNNYNVCEYIQEANKAIAEIDKKDKAIIITGGTGMYLKGLLYGILKDNKKSSKVREELELELTEKGIEPLLEELKKVDPKKYSELKVNDHRRVIRALEFYRINGIPLSQMQVEWNNSDQGDDFIILGLNMERETLYLRINERVDLMMKAGFLDEVKDLITMKVPDTASCWQAIGYKEIKSHLEGEFDLVEAIRLIKRNSRRYAKRQLTWFRKVDNVKWFDASDLEVTLNQIITYINHENNSNLKLIDG